MMRTLLTIFMIASFAIMGLTSPVLGQKAEKVDMVKPFEDHMLGQYEKSDREFLRLQNEELKIISFFHQRKIGEAIVEKDFIRYKFASDTGELIEEKRQWREDLSEDLPPIIPKEQAESIVEGEVRFSTLNYISPKSEVFPIKPTPKNPCWVVRSKVDGRPVVTIIDAITGEKLGYGVPPPSDGLSIHGPDWGACPQDPIWFNHAENARSWFETIGYSTTRVGNASEATIQSHIQSDTTAMFYELDHGGSTSFHNRCDQDITAAEIDTWIASYANMPFTFLGSCDGMCDLTDSHFSFEFRKGSNIDTVTVGYCGMSTVACETNCWGDAIAWQTELFTHMNHGDTIWWAFGQANLDFPLCAGANNCMRFAGDTTLIVKPVVTRSLCGTLTGPWPAYIYYLSPGSRDHYFRCDITAGGNGVIVNASTTLVFLNNSKVTASSPFVADGSSGTIWFVSEANRSNGIKLNGELSMTNGGQIKIYE